MIYKDIPGYPGYQACSDGSIWSFKLKGGNDRASGQRSPMPKRMTIHRDRAGYCHVNLTHNGRNVVCSVHRLVLEAFIGPCPEGMEACHYPDHDKTNNRPENLRWATRDANMEDNYRDRLPVIEKTCRRCCKMKPATEFYGDKRASDGLQGECKACHQAIVLATSDPEKRRKAKREWMRKYRAKS